MTTITSRILSAPAFVIALMAASTLMAGCHQNLPLESLPSGMILPASATYVRRTERPGRAVELAYRSNEPYPAAKLLSEVQPPVSGEGWHELTEDWLKPGAPSTRGWGSYDDASRQPHMLVHQWGGEWLDGDGNLLLLDVQ